MVIVSMKMNNKLMKNWDAVRARFAMLEYQLVPTRTSTHNKDRLQVYDQVKEHHLDEYQWYIHDDLCQRVCCRAIERARIS